ncbi:MAG: NAD-dependent epimerase/dehydratase family protein [Planctomycetota bacterium]|nr:NAD-dependent epimerase/dehydratase family protein [Planctomycetota bacterium]
MTVHEFKGQTVLVVGGAGFIGGNLVNMLVGAHPARVCIVDNLLSAEEAGIPRDPIVEFIRGSIADDDVLMRLENKFDYVFHLATFHGNQNSIADPIADHDNNTLTTLKLFERIRSFDRLKKVVYSSAGCTVAEKTFDAADATHEDAPVSLQQDSPYAISKIVGEFYSLYYHRRHALPVVRARFQNVYGPGEILGAGRWRGTPATVWRNVVPVFVYKAVKGLPLPLENNGIATRDFVFVDDICRGLLACATRGKPGDVYNLASGGETGIADLAAAVNDIAGNRAAVESLPRREWDSAGKRFGCTEKSRRELGFECAVPLREGLKRTVAWTRENLPLIEQCIAKHRADL